MKRRLMKQRRKQLKQKQLNNPTGKQGFSIRYFYLFSFLLMLIVFIYGIIMFNDYGDLLSPDYLDEVILNHYYSIQPTVGSMIRLFLKEISFYAILWFLSFTIIGIIVVIFAIF